MDLPSPRPNFTRRAHDIQLGMNTRCLWSKHGSLAIAILKHVAHLPRLYRGIHLVYRFLYAFLSLQSLQSASIAILPWSPCQSPKCTGWLLVEGASAGRRDRIPWVLWIQAILFEQAFGLSTRVFWVRVASGYAERQAPVSQQWDGAAELRAHDRASPITNL
jgi:hypothetical protein